MCNRAVDNYHHTLEFIPDCFKTQEKFNKTVSTYPSVIQFVPECCKTRKMYSSC